MKSLKEINDELEADYKCEPVETVEDVACRGSEPEITDPIPFDPKTSNLYQHAVKELQWLIDADEEEDDEDPNGGPNKWAYDNILELIEVFARQGHSGMSAPYVIDIFKELANYKIIGGLTGEDDEWNDVSEYGDGTMLYQNNRDSRVFKDTSGAWFLDGTLFEDPIYPGNYMSTKKSREYIKSFPYTPKTTYKKAPLWKRIAAKLFPKHF